MATMPNPSETRILMENVSWETYERLRDENPDRAGLRMTYDEGCLEIMIVSRPHERPNRILAQIVEVVTEELEIDIEHGGSTTFQRKDLTKGFEPDSCFYIKNAQTVRDNDEAGGGAILPPDLLIEIDVTSPSLPRFPLFAAAGVAEVCRYDGQQVQVFVLVKGSYEERERSIALPPLTSEVLTRFLIDSTQMKSTVWLRHIRAWVRERSAEGRS